MLTLRVLGARGDCLGNQRIHVSGTLGGAVKLKMQRGHGVNMQALEQTIAQEASRSRQCRLCLFWIAGEQTVVHRGMRVIGRNLHRVDRDHAHMRIFQFARDQLRQIPLDLVAHADTAIGGGAVFFWHVLVRKNVNAKDAEVSQNSQKKYKNDYFFFCVFCVIFASFAFYCLEILLQSSRNFLDLKELQHIALLDVVVAFDVQAALEAFFDFFGIVFEAFERFELACKDHHVVAQQTQTR